MQGVEKSIHYRRVRAFEYERYYRMGYVDYFLIVWDFIKFARDNDIMVGRTRKCSGNGRLCPGYNN